MIQETTVYYSIIQRYKETEIKIQEFKETTVYYIDTRIKR